MDKPVRKVKIIAHPDTPEQIHASVEARTHRSVMSAFRERFAQIKGRLGGSR